MPSNRSPDESPRRVVRSPRANKPTTPQVQRLVTKTAVIKLLNPITRKSPVARARRSANLTPREVPSPGETSSTNLTPRRSLPRSSKPTKIREIPSDDDLETSIELDSREFTKALVKKRLSQSRLKAKSPATLQNENPPVLQIRNPPKAKKAYSLPLRRTPSAKSEESPSSGSEVESPPSSDDSFTETPKSKLIRISKNVQQRQKELKGSDDPRRKKQRTEQLRGNNPPIPLSKTKLTETQKPLLINIERLTTHRNRDKRTKIHTLDVIKQLLDDFSPPTDSSKESRLHNDFKQYLNNHLEYLMDIHSSINDLSSRISQVQRMKNEIRSEIFEVKKSHALVGDDLNKLRRENKSERVKKELLDEIFEQVQSLKQDRMGENLDAKVAANLHSLQGIVNPTSGVYQKLLIINEKLGRIDKEL